MTFTSKKQIRALELLIVMFHYEPYNCHVVDCGIVKIKGRLKYFDEDGLDIAVIQKNEAGYVEVLSRGLNDADADYVIYELEHLLKKPDRELSEWEHFNEKKMAKSISLAAQWIDHNTTPGPSIAVH